MSACATYQQKAPREIVHRLYNTRSPPSAQSAFIKSSNFLHVRRFFYVSEKQVYQDALCRVREKSEETSWRHFECPSFAGPRGFGQAPSPFPAGVKRSSASASPPFLRASHPCKLLPSEEPKRAQLGELGGQLRVSFRCCTYGTQAHFLSRVRCLCS